MAQALGIDLIHLGVVMIVTWPSACTLPPWASTCMWPAASQRSSEQISRAVVPLLIASIIVLLIVTYIPGISTVFTS